MYFDCERGLNYHENKIMQVYHFLPDFNAPVILLLINLG